jgi:hypothetical protein
LVALQLGLGVVGRLALEVVFHVGLVRFIAAPVNRVLASSLRPFVGDELLILARDELGGVEAESGRGRWDAYPQSSQSRGSSCSSSSLP